MPVTSPRRVLAAGGLLAALLAGLAALVAWFPPGDSNPTESPTPAVRADPPTVAHPSPDETVSPSAPAPRRQARAPIREAQLAAAIDRAEAFVRDWLAWRHDEPVAARRRRLAAHLTDDAAGEYSGRLGTADVRHRRKVEWVSTGEVDHSYPETITTDRVVVVVIATQHITTRSDSRTSQASHTVEVVPTDAGWRVAGMVF